MRRFGVICIAVLLGCGGRPQESAQPDPPLTVVFAGDSLTQQWQWYWKDTMPQTYLNYTDEGVGGNTSGLLLARYQHDILASDARVVHILIGTNDSVGDIRNNSIPLEVTEHNITQMVSAAKARFHLKEVVIGTVPPVTAQFPQSALINDHVRELNQWIRQFGVQWKIPVADYYSVLEQDGYLNPTYCIDGRVHLNKAGYEVISPLTLAAFNEIPSAP